MTKAKSVEIPMFSYKGSQYPFLVANRTGTIGSPIIPPGADRPVAILGADFAWGQSEPFLEHLNLKLRDERNVREDEAVRKRANLTQQNASLFKDLCQGGFIIKIDESGDQDAPVKKTRDQMLAYQPEIQAQLINDWLGNFHVQRTFPEGSTDVDALLSTPDAIFFECRIGSYKKPTHILVFEFAVPSPDARRSYETDTFVSGTSQQGDKVVSNYYVNHKAKLQFAKKYFRGVQGSILGKDGEFENDTADLRPIDKDNSDDLQDFKTFFNPNWWIVLADSLADCFNFAGK